MGVQEQEGAAQSQSQRPPNRKTQSQGLRSKMCNSIAEPEQPTRKALASESSASNRNDRRDAKLHNRADDSP
eukprot:12782333-Alexandrium_andersonii.AAC.1